MSQRGSGYRRKADDAYQTPDWVTRAICPHIAKLAKCVWEPAAGDGQMAKALRDYGFDVRTSGSTEYLRPGRRRGKYLGRYTDFGGNFFDRHAARPDVQAIVTNPPFSQAEGFIEHALKLMKSVDGASAFLLRVDYDSAVSRQYLFNDCPQFAMKLVLTKRIVWFKKKGAAPSFNHAWFVWDWKHRGPPIIRYDVQQ